MDESEPEQMFSRESRKLEAVAKWRMARAELVHEGKGPLPLVGEVNMLFQVIPLDSLDRVPLNSSWRVPEQRKSQIYATARPTTFRYNHDGFLASATVGNESSAYGYTQIFRSGILEYAVGDCFSSPGNGFAPMILGQYLEQEMVRHYENATDWLRSSGSTSPVYIGFCLLGIASKSFFSTIRGLMVGSRSVSPVINIFISPETIADPKKEEQSPYGETLLPLVDTMWQLAGYESSPFNIPREGWMPFREYR